MKIKTGIIIIALAAIMAGSSAYAESNNALTESQKTVLQELRNSGDRSAVASQLKEWGKKLQNKGLRKNTVFESLTQTQKQTLHELRESNVEKEIIQDQLKEFGIELPEKNKRHDLTDDQKEIIQSLKDAGDKQELKDYFKEIGIEKFRSGKEARAYFINLLTDNEKETLSEARTLAKAGDTETARLMIDELFTSNSNLEKPTNGISGFFKKIFAV